MDHLRPDQLAELLCLSKRTIYRALAQGSAGGFKKITIRGQTRVVVPEEVKTMKLGDCLLRPNDVARALDVSRSTIYRLYQEGRLMGCMIAERNLRIYKSGIVSYLEEKARRKEGL